MEPLRLLETGPCSVKDGRRTGGFYLGHCSAGQRYGPVRRVQFVHILASSRRESCLGRKLFICMMRKQWCDVCIVTTKEGRSKVSSFSIVLMSSSFESAY
jgi:hypothetical protein